VAFPLVQTATAIGPVQHRSTPAGTADQPTPARCRRLRKCDTRILACESQADEWGDARLSLGRCAP
jgi:hypothetical protein